MAKERLDFIISASVADFSAAVKKGKNDLKSLTDAVKDSKGALNKGVVATAGEKEARRQADLLLGTLKELTAQERELTRQQKARLAGQVASYKAALQGASPSFQNAAAEKARATEERANQARTRAAAKEAESFANHSITLRYALYDVASATRSAGMALLSFTSAALQAQMAQQAAFAQIEKTQAGTATTAAQLEDLKNQLIALSSEIPVSFTELAKIGTLGAQLGVNAKDIAAFTEVTAKFSAITGMSAEESAMGFGKVANLLQLSGDQYEALGSSIAKVGVTSAATEQQIINTAGQVGAIGKAAGLTASEIIGLSSAMASLKIAPEEARGVLIPTFHAMDIATRSFSSSLGTGSEQLKIFAEISGMSQEDFVSKWGNKSSGSAGEVWTKFIQGLGNTDISAALNRLNLDGIRTSKGLTALGSNATAVFEQIANATQAGSISANGSFLDDASVPIFETLTAKFEMLQNSIENLNAAAASNSGFIDLIGWVVDRIKDFNVVLARLLGKNDFMSWITGATLGMTAFIGVLLTATAAVAAGSASMLAMRTAYINYTQASGVATSGTMNFLRSILGMPPASAAASASLKGLAVAEGQVATGSVVASRGVNILKWSIRGLLASTGIGALIVGIGFVTEALIGASEQSDNAATDLDVLAGKANKTADEISLLTSELVAMVEASTAQVDKIADVQQAVYNLGKGMQDAKNDFSVYTQAGRANLQNLNAAMTAIAKMSGSQQELANNLLALQNAMIAVGVTAPDAFDAINIAIANTEKTAQAATTNFTGALQSGFTAITTGATKAKTALEKLDEILQKVFRGYDVRIGLLDSLDALGKSIAENGTAFGYGTSGMRDNLEALQDTISAFKDSSNGDLEVFRSSLLSLRAAMLKAGVTGGGALTLINAALAKTGTKGKASAKQIESIFNSISGSIKKNAKTIADYVGDLGTALGDAFSNRYGTEEAMDRITSAFNDMKSSAADASKAIADAQNEIAGIKADKGILEYQLSVAVRYGDTLRATSIRAKLAKANADIADQEKKITENQQTLNRSIVGTSASAVENRAKLRELVQAGNAYLLTLAKGGMSSANLQIEAKKLADDFLLQGKNLGFAESELKSYLDAFTKDFSTVVTGIPKDVNIVVNTDPALEAIKKFVTDANAAMDGLKFPSTSTGTKTTTAPKTTVTNGKSDTGIAPKPTADPGAGWTWAYNASKKSWEKAPGVDTSKTPTPAGLSEYLANYAALKKEMDEWNKKDWFAQAVTKIPHAAVLDGLLKKIGNFEATVGSLKYKPYDVKIGYATGGLVQGPGTATSDSIPARVSSGEYIVQANAVRYYGTDFMNALNNIQVQRQSYSGANSGTNGMVYLSPEDRQLLRAAIERPINLYADSKQLASTVSAGNVSLARRGLN